MAESRVLICPSCHRVSSIAPWCKRPICVHAWVDIQPEIWDGDNCGPEGDRRIEDSPEPKFRTPGPHSWAEMVPFTLDELATLAAAVKPQDPTPTYEREEK